MQIVLDTRGLQFSVRNKCFYIQSETTSRIIHPSRINSILVTAPCRISSPALILAAQSEIPVTICNPSGKPEVRMWTPRFLNIASLRRKQYQYSTTTSGLKWAFSVLLLKMEGQLTNLTFLADRKTSLAGDVQKIVAECNLQIDKVKGKLGQSDMIQKKDLFFVEAYTASRYWQNLGLKLPEPFNFTNRIKKDPRDLFNNTINYLYGMLRNTTESSILSMGIDPALGILHRDGYKTPSLVFDLMEPFRPVIDKVLVRLILENKLDPVSAIEGNGPVLLSKLYRRQIISIFNETLKTRLLFRNSVNTLQNHILTEVSCLVNQIKSISLQNEQ